MNTMLNYSRASIIRTSVVRSINYRNYRR